MAKLKEQEVLDKLSQIIEASEGIEYGYLEIQVEQGHIKTVDGYRRRRTLHDGREVKQQQDT